MTHACGYEHPCQFTMDDVDLTVGDKNLIKTLAQSFMYHKYPVPFESMKALSECPHLGGNYHQLQAQKISLGMKKRNLVRY